MVYVNWMCSSNHHVGPFLPGQGPPADQRQGQIHAVRGFGAAVQGTDGGEEGQRHGPAGNFLFLIELEFGFYQALLYFRASGT